MITQPPDNFDFTAGVIQQVPLGVQTIDLESLKASERQVGQSLYPDNLIPVASFIQGQHPNTGSAQTVETDGKHALKIALPPGAGGEPLPLVYHDAFFVDQYDLFPVQQNLGPLHILYRVQIAAAYVDDTGGGEPLGAQCYIGPHGLPVQSSMLFGIVPMPIGASYVGMPLPPIDGVWSFGWDIATAMSNPSGMWDIRVTTGHGKVTGWMTFQGT